MKSFQSFLNVHGNVTEAHQKISSPLAKLSFSMNFRILAALSLKNYLRDLLPSLIQNWTSFNLPRNTWNYAARFCNLNTLQSIRDEGQRSGWEAESADAFRKAFSSRRPPEAWDKGEICVEQIGLRWLSTAGSMSNERAEEREQRKAETARKRRQINITLSLLRESLVPLKLCFRRSRDASLLLPFGFYCRARDSVKKKLKVSVCHFESLSFLSLRILLWSHYHFLRPFPATYCGV